MKLLVILVLFIAACGGNGQTQPTIDPSLIETTVPILITVIVTATPEPTAVVTPTVEPVILPTPTATVAPTPQPTPTPSPTSTPHPASTPIIVEQTVVHKVVVEIPVTVVVTATPTPTPTNTPTPTPIPTETPVPTATPIPPLIQHLSGNGSWISGPLNFWDGRTIEIDIAVIGTGSFELSAITSNGCVFELSSGTAPYTAKTIAEPLDPTTCDGLNQFGNGAILAVTAGGNASWVVDLTQYSQPIAQNPPVSLTASGQNIFGPFRLGQGEILKVFSEGNTAFSLDVYSVYENEPFVKRVIDVPGTALGTWRIGAPLGIYMFAITTAPDREWTAELLFR